jgi:carbon monoxide dehydrogenase subunit G
MEVLPPSVVTTDRGFSFDLPPDQIWSRLEEFDQFESWWSWLSDFRVEGEGLQAGSVLYGSINPPLPYRMDVRVELVECDRPTAIRARISGDLIGDAHLRFEPEAAGTLAKVTWAIEMRQPAMGLASRIGHPVLQWGHDRVVELTVAGFRRRIADSQAVRPEQVSSSTPCSEGL